MCTLYERRRWGLNILQFVHIAAHAVYVGARNQWNKFFFRMCLLCVSEWEWHVRWLSCSSFHRQMWKLWYFELVLVCAARWMCVAYKWHCLTSEHWIILVLRSEWIQSVSGTQTHRKCQARYDCRVAHIHGCIEFVIFSWQWTLNMGLSSKWITGFDHDNTYHIDSSPPTPSARISFACSVFAKRCM